MTIAEYARQWVKKALNDLKAAEQLLDPKAGGDEIITESVCFHCQQAAEKLLKAFLISKNINVGKVHTIESILEICIEADREFEKINPGNLTDYAVKLRYPGDMEIPDLDETRNAYDIACEIKRFVLMKLNYSED